MATFLFYERIDEGTRIVAKLEGEKFTGVQAAEIEKLLREEGWPDRSPVRILTGSRLWAVEVQS
jgi:hypothetical protein